MLSGPDETFDHVPTTFDHVPTTFDHLGTSDPRFHDRYFFGPVVGLS